jgi:GPH family glycoside/pentoside/hexuronide:cation symporter
MAAPPRLSTSQLVAYAVPGAGVSFMESLIQFYLLKFAADVLLVSPGLTGLLLGGARVWDALSDPLAGYASDRTRTRLGRRRPWILAAAPALAIGFLALWSPPASLSDTALAGWMGAALLLFVSAQTAFQVPHLALGAELTDDERDRNRVFAVRLAFSLSGYLLAALALGRLERAPDPARNASAIALGAGIATALLCGLAVWVLREPADSMRRSAASPYRAFGDVLRNPHARLLLSVLFLEAIGFATMTTSMAFATKYLFQREGQTSFLLAGALLAMLTSVPLWLRLARRYGRLRLWIASLIGRALAFGSMLVLPASAWQVVAMNVVVIGALFGCGAIFGPAVKADVIDDEARRSGERKEGTFFASWNLAQKSAEGAAIVLAGAVLEISRFEPNAVQQADALFGIRALFAALPCLFYAAAALLLARWPRSSRTCVSASQDNA